MKIPDLAPELLASARAGELAALDDILKQLQPGVFNLALRMLGQREDAQDATQEILLKVITHLGTFRGESAFGTWVWRIARNHLSTAATRAREAPEVSLDALGERLAAGLAYSATLGTARALTPADKAEAREVAIRCTQGMLLSLNREHRLAYVLDVVFGLPSDQAAEVLEITAVAYRKRLSRAKEEIETFASKTCGLANPCADCRCEKQLPAVRATRAGNPAREALALKVEAAELAQAEQTFATLSAWTDAAAVFRAHPQYQAPGAMLEAIRGVLATGRRGTQP